MFIYIYIYIYIPSWRSWISHAWGLQYIHTSRSRFQLTPAWRSLAVESGSFWSLQIAVLFFCEDMRLCGDVLPVLFCCPHLEGLPRPHFLTPWCTSECLWPVCTCADNLLLVILAWWGSTSTALAPSLRMNVWEGWESNQGLCIRMFVCVCECLCMCQWEKQTYYRPAKGWRINSN